MSSKEIKPEAEKEEEEVEEKAEAPKWAIELGAKFDKMADAFTRYAEAVTTKQEEEEKPPEEEEPKEEEKQEEEEEKLEEEEKPIEEEKMKSMIEAAIAKRFTEVEKKKSKVPKEDEVSNVLTYDKIAKMSWRELNDIASGGK
jgi:hypothetical protein